MSIIASTRQPAYTALTNEQVEQAYREADARKRSLYAAVDALPADADTSDLEREQNAVEAELFSLDDELCARGLDLPC